MPRRTSGRLRPRQSAGRYPPPKPLLMLPGAEFLHPIGGGARFRPEAPGETEHRQRARRLPRRRRRAFLPLQPGQQLPGMRLIQLFHLLNDHLDCAHVGSVAPAGNVANSTIGNGALVSKPNGAKIARMLCIYSYLRLLTAGSLVRISLRVMAWRRATVSVTLRLAAIACLAAWYCSWDKA